MSDCSIITPLSAFMSSNLSNKMTDFNRLGDRIMRSLGAPMIAVELHNDQLYENIAIACEMFTKYAGYTAEYLVFDSRLYDIKNNGIKLDTLFSITPSFNRINQPSNAMYIATATIPSSTFSTSTTLSATYANGIYKNQILSGSDYGLITAFDGSLSGNFVTSNPDIKEQHSNVFDYDIMDYRKVIDVVDFEEGSNTGVNTLFTLEQTMAQQTYFSYSMGNYGFDLISWYTLKNWLNTREKMLAVKRTLSFNPRTQYLNVTPRPKTDERFWGIVSCYVEKPLRDIIKEQWVYQYALALCKITVGQIRSKYSGTVLFGGGTISGTIIDQGMKEKEELEKKIYEGIPGLGDADPPLFFVG